MRKFRWSILGAFFALLVTATCGKPPLEPLYCDEKTPCTDPSRPFCDVEGKYPASGGHGNMCIPVPEECSSCSGTQPICAGGGCRGCESQEECLLMVGPDTFCAPTGECGACSTCGGMTPICSPTGCRACASAEECVPMVGNGAYCGWNGECGSCSTCGGTTPGCDPLGGCRACASQGSASRLPGKGRSARPWETAVPARAVAATRPDSPSSPASCGTSGAFVPDSSRRPPGQSSVISRASTAEMG